jgi:hypothetical protein
MEMAAATAIVVAAISNVANGTLENEAFSLVLERFRARPLARVACCGRAIDIRVICGMCPTRFFSRFSHARISAGLERGFY